MKKTENSGLNRMLLLAGLTLFVRAGGFAQDLDARIQAAVDGLARRLTAPVEVSVGAVTIAETDAPTAFSRYLHTKITFFAVANGMYRVVENSGASRGVNRIRPSGGQAVEITGTYQKLGETVQAMLYLRPVSGGAAIAASSFSVLAAELEKMELAVLPANSATWAEVRQTEKMFAALPEKNAFHVEAWADSASGTYYEGGTMTVYFASDADCYYKMYYINAQGKMTLIYPTRRSGGNFLRANTVKEMKFECVPPYGRETFLFMASEEPFSVTDADFAEIDADGAAIERAVRGLRYQGDQRSAVRATPIASARFSYTILPAAQDKR
jgi:hypothetical protein